MSDQINDQSDAVREVVIEALQTELVAISAGIRFWAEWVRLADTYTESLRRELTRIREDAVPLDQVVGRVADLSREYARNLAGLPAIPLKHFSAEIEKIGVRKKRRTRSARAKD